MTKPKAYSYIRFSTRDQRKGSSLHRQLKHTRDFARRHGLELQEQTYEDLGVSGFRGQHARTGALSAFISAVEEGKIDPGSWLLIESIDRLGRDQLNAAFSRFQQLLQLGITIATLGENKIFRPESANELGEIMVSLVSMSRAHEESLRKSQLSAGAWDKTRETVAETGKAPAKGGITPWWLKKHKDGSFSVIPERGEALRQMFQWALEGNGSVRLAKLMTERFSHLDPKKRWTTGVISNLTRGRTVLGEWQPKRQIIDADGRKRFEAVGKPVKLYPTVVDEGVWLRVQQQRKARDTMTGRAATESGVTNLFSGLLRCECDTAIRLGRESYICRTVEYGQACTHRQSVNKRFLETMTLTALHQFLRNHALPGSSIDKLKVELDALESTLALCRTQQYEAKRKASNALDALIEDDGTLREALSRRASELEMEAQKISDRLTSLESQKSELLAELSKPKGEEEEMVRALSQMSRNDEGRHKISHALRTIVDTMALSAMSRKLTVKLKPSYGIEAITITWNKPIRGRIKSLEWEAYAGQSYLMAGVIGLGKPEPAAP